MFFYTLKRAFISKRYVIALVGTVIMCYICAKDYMNDTNMPCAYIIELIINLSMFKKIMVFFSAVPFVCSYCKDNNSKYINLILTRGKKNTYIISNILSCVLSSFSASFIGIIIFALLISSKFNANSDIELLYCNVHINNQTLYILIMVSIFALYCTVWTIAGFAFSSILPNMYVALGTPLIFGYLLEELTYKMPDALNLYKLSHCVKIINGTPLANYLYTFCVFIMLIALFGALFAYFVKRRVRNEMA